MRAIVLAFICCLAWEAAAGGEASGHTQISQQSSTIDSSQACVHASRTYAGSRGIVHMLHNPDRLF